jgi:internalin A
LTDLDLYNNRISDISPLAALLSLWKLSLGANQISDIGPLAGLTSVTSFYVEANQISDISPLTANPGLGQGCRISLDGNRLDLSPESDDMQTINTLMRRGASVCY